MIINNIEFNGHKIRLWGTDNLSKRRNYEMIYKTSHRYWEDPGSFFYLYDADGNRIFESRRQFTYYKSEYIRTYKHK